MAFWGTEVRPGKSYTHRYDSARGRLRISQATLGVGKQTTKSVLQCNVGNKSPVLLCALLPDVIESCHLDLEFEEDEEVVFSVLGQRSIHLSGFYIGSKANDTRDETDSYGEDIAETDNSFSSFDSEDEYESDFIDDGDIDMFPSSPKRKSGVVIEEIVEEAKPANGDANHLGSRRKHHILDGDDESQRQPVLKPAPATAVESEDEDGFPISLLESKDAVNTNTEGHATLNNKSSDQDRKRKIHVVSQDSGSARETLHLNGSSLPSEKFENDEMLKKKKKVKKSKPVVSASDKQNKKSDVETDNESMPESKENGLPIEVEEAVPVSIVKLKKKMNEKAKKVKASSTATEVQDKGDQDKVDNSGKMNQDNPVGQEQLSLSRDDACLTNGNQQEAKKKKKKKEKKHEKDLKLNHEKTTPPEAEDKKQPLKTRSFANGMIIEELSMGKPDGKRTSPGCKVSVIYIGKLLNGTIFDSNVGKRPFKFRLGIGEVVKGWDVGVNGMRVGDKRRLTIPPAMGYGDRQAGKIPKNSWLMFDVELVDVQ